MIELREAQMQVEKFLNDTYDARVVSEKCRDYYDGRQWTEQQVARLKKRRQAPIVSNRIKPKVNGLVGLYNLRKTDPKAYPRTEKHTEGAQTITDALRYVADNTDFDDTRLEVGGEFFTEGYGGAIIDVQQRKNGEIDIRIEQIPWDRIYYDPNSRKKDFSDARFMGIVLWMSEDEAEEKFPDADIDNMDDAISDADETFEDRPRWIDSSANRVRIALHFYIHKSVWHMCAFGGSKFVVKPRPSPFLDEDGEPMNPIELVSGNVDRDNMRYGEVKNFLDPQDEINHKRSKIQHFGSSRQTYGRKGEYTDIAKLKREMSDPSGHVEFEGEEFGKDFGILPTGDMSRVQFELYNDAKAELDAVSFNAQLAGDRQSGELSGVAIDKLQRAGTIELNGQYALITGWERRVYRQVWARIKQFWTQEKWIRVTDNQDDMRFVGFNQPITFQAMLEETINDESLPQQDRQQAAQVFTAMMQVQDPRLQQSVETRNEIAQMDVDIIIDQSFDVVNIQQEQFKLIAQFAQGANIDVIELIELSEIRGKEELIEKIEKRRQQAAQAQQGAIQVEAESKQMANLLTRMQAAKTEQEAIQKGAETEIMIASPDPNPQLSV